MTVVYLTGLDGTGKSTLASSLMVPGSTEALKNPFRVHQYDALLPISRWAKSVLRKRGLKAKLDPAFKPEAETATSDGGSAGSGPGRVVSLVSTGWLVSGFGRAWVRAITARSTRRDMVSDRCFVDEVLRCEWSLGQESALARRLLALSPKPDLLVVLTPAELTVSWKRKKEFEYSREAYEQKYNRLTEILRAPALGKWNTLHIEVDELMTATRVFETVRARLSEGTG